MGPGVAACAPLLHRTLLSRPISPGASLIKMVLSPGLGRRGVIPLHSACCWIRRIVLAAWNIVVPVHILPLGERCAGCMASDTYWLRFVPQAFGEAWKRHVWRHHLSRPVTDPQPAAMRKEPVAER